jgi:hypothetical protein
MNNTLTCKNCNEQNPYYALICKKCKSYLRDRIYNIDLWRMLSLLIESPAKAFSLIIHSEHKNFVTLIILLASAKLFIDSMFFSLLPSANEPNHQAVIFNYFIILGSVFVFLLIAAIVVTIINKSFNLKTRIRDNFAIFTYSLLPHIFAFLVLFTVEAAVFGENLFATNPSVFSLKATFAFILLGFEILVLLWGIFLAATAMYVQSKNMGYSIIGGVIFNLLLYFCLYIDSRILYG